MMMIREIEMIEMGMVEIEMVWISIRIIVTFISR